jgi:hypothetical protein
MDHYCLWVGGMIAENCRFADTLRRRLHGSSVTTSTQPPIPSRRTEIMLY